MKLPLVLEESGTVRDADGRVVISKINPCTIPERKIAGQRAAIRALESKISQPHRVARRVAENPEAKDPPHGAVRKG